MVRAIGGDYTTYSGPPLGDWKDDFRNKVIPVIQDLLKELEQGKIPSDDEISALWRAWFDASENVPDVFAVQQDLKFAKDMLQSIVLFKNMPDSTRISGYVMLLNSMLDNINAAINNKDTSGPHYDKTIDEILKSYPWYLYNASEYDALIAKLEEYRKSLPDPSQERVDIGNAITAIQLSEMVVGSDVSKGSQLQSFVWALLLPYRK